jgi:hypothetical protein
MTSVTTQAVGLLFPLVKRVSRHQTAPPRERGPEHAGGRDRLGARVDRLAPALRIFLVMGDQPPLQQFSTFRCRSPV